MYQSYEWDDSLQKWLMSLSLTTRHLHIPQGWRQKQTIPHSWHPFESIPSYSGSNYLECFHAIHMFHLQAHIILQSTVFKLPVDFYQMSTLGRHWIDLMNDGTLQKGRALTFTHSLVFEWEWLLHLPKQFSAERNQSWIEICFDSVAETVPHLGD